MLVLIILATSAVFATVESQMTVAYGTSHGSVVIVPLHPKTASSSPYVFLQTASPTVGSAGRGGGASGNGQGWGFGSMMQALSGRDSVRGSAKFAPIKCVGIANGGTVVVAVTASLVILTWRFDIHQADWLLVDTLDALPDMNRPIAEQPPNIAEELTGEEPSAGLVSLILHHVI